MTRRLLALPAAALLLSLAACGASSSTVPAPGPIPSGALSATTPAPAPATTSVASGVPSDNADQTISVTVAGGKVTGPTERVAVKLGSRLRVTVTADVTDVVHIHVYDLKENVAPGTPASIGFVADKPGQVKVELEQAGLTLAQLIVS